MADDIKAGLDTVQVTPETEPKVEPITAEERAELETLRKQSELSKNEIVTRDRKLTELQKEVKMRMTEEERIKSESQSVLNELLEEFAVVASNSIGLDDKHRALIKGSTKEEIKASAELVKSYSEYVRKDDLKTIKALEDKIKILEANGTTPKTGIADVVSKMEFTREELKDPEARKLYNSTPGAYIKNE